MMPSFNDAMGRTWNLNLTIGRCREIRDTSGIDFGDTKNGGGFLELAVNTEKFVQVLWILIEKQADALKVTPDDFAESLDGDALDRAGEALNEAIVRFSPAVMRPAMEKAINKTLATCRE